MEMAEIIAALHHEDEVQEAWEEHDQIISALQRSSSIVELSHDREDEDEEEGTLLFFSCILFRKGVLTDKPQTS
jgi:hypothetical protein